MIQQPGGIGHRRVNLRRLLSDTGDSTRWLSGSRRPTWARSAAPVRSRRDGPGPAGTCRTPRCTGCRQFGRTDAPHVTPLLGVWLDGALYFCTGPTERKARNLAQNPWCVLATGCNTLDNGLDLVVEGEAAKVSDEAELRSVAEAFESKYGSHFTAPEGT
jgi:Pyridoxamine 5'-phosphate oxidase